MTDDLFTPERVKNALSALRLNAVAERFEQEYPKACAEGTGMLEFMAGVLEPEVLGRKQRRFERLLKQANLEMNDCIEAYDVELAASRGVEASRVRDMATGEFVTHSRNVVLAGAVGTGKTRLGRLLGAEACRRDFSTVFVNTRDLIEKLFNARESFAFEKIYRFYRNIDLLILDDLAYMPFAPEKVEFLFRLIFDRHEKKKGALVITTNSDVKEWWTFFPSKAMGMAFSDRVLGGAVGIKFSGDSIRPAKHQKK